MNHPQPYPPPLSPIPEDPLLGNPCDPCDPRRPMNPLAGIWATHRNTYGYREASPDGDEILFVLEGIGSARSQQTAHHSLLTANLPADFPAPPVHPIQHSTFSIQHWTYTFSAKERDPETGLSYFGSRYYSSDLSVWLSVDPMAKKYPSLSPYVYCANNPVKLVDPDGEEVWIPGVDDNGNVTYTAEKGDDHDSFVRQFDTQGKSRDIFKNAGFGINSGDVKEGDVIKGDAVKKATGSDVLKGNWHNMTNSQKASQLIFAIRYSACNADWYFDLRDFVNGFQIGGGGFNFSASNVPDGNGGFIQIHNISVGCTYDNTVMTAELFWNEDSRANRDIYSTRNIYNNSPGHRPMIMFTLDKGNENSERFSRMVRCK